MSGNMRFKSPSAEHGPTDGRCTGQQQNKKTSAGYRQCHRQRPVEPHVLCSHAEKISGASQRGQRKNLVGGDGSHHETPFVFP